MKRLVYSPSVNAWVKTDTGVFDLSPYVTDCSIDRRVNSVSFAKLTFRNPKIPDLHNPKKQRFLFTEHVRDDGSIHPMLHPMDPIIITMTRLKGRPIQVFTGFCDTTPYIQLYPGTAELTASCTLKRLQYTYWDPALPFVQEFMLANGWVITKSGTALNPSAEQRNQDKINKELNDTSIGFLLYKILKEVGGWDKNDIYIQGLPPKIGQLVAKLYQDTEKENTQSIKDFHDFLHQILGASAYGSLASSSAAGANGPNLEGANSGVDPNSLPKGAGNFEGTIVASWIVPVLTWARQHGWTGSLTSGYRTVEHNAEIGGATNSNHTKLDYPGGAIDVGSKDAYAEGKALNDALANYPHTPTLVWGQNTPFDGSAHDYGHFSAGGH